jgi:histone H4
MASGVYNETRVVLRDFLQQILKDAILYTEHAGRKTVTPTDVVYALKRHGQLMYGYGK